MDGQGLDERLRKGALRLAAGIAFAGALIGGAAAYIASYSSGNHPAGAPSQSVQQKAPVPK